MVRRFITKGKGKGRKVIPISGRATEVPVKVKPDILSKPFTEDITLSGNDFFIEYDPKHKGLYLTERTDYVSGEDDEEEMDDSSYPYETFDFELVKDSKVLDRLIRSELESIVSSTVVVDGQILRVDWYPEGEVLVLVSLPDNTKYIFKEV
ncbi:hypothetical protein GQ472_01730 [archaeon]|nr:hypothetical protein [archaeon]